MTKLVIDIRNGLIEADGERDFVETIYAHFKDVALARLLDAKAAEVQTPQSYTTTPTATEKSKPTRRSKAGGPSCASRIEGLKVENFFDEPRTPSEVREKLSEKGSTYESKNVAAALNNLIKSSKLRRFKFEGNWKYQNP